MIIIPAGELSSPGMYKYVRFADGNVCFCDATLMYGSHANVADEYRHPILPGDPLGGQPIPPVGAGTIKIRDKRWYISEGGSMTLKLHRMPSDQKFIDRVLSPLGYVYDEELAYSF